MRVSVFTSVYNVGILTRPLLVGLWRKALKDFTFSDGTFLPKGTLVGIANRSIHHDEKFYESANVFKPFRFAEMHGEDGDGAKNQFVSTTMEYLAFGHGKHAWYDASFLFFVVYGCLIYDCLIALDVSLLQMS